jgi:hypothetical protein
VLENAFAESLDGGFGVGHWNNAARQGDLCRGAFHCLGRHRCALVVLRYTDSLDIIRMMDASENAIVHAVIWTRLGVGFVLWYMIGPGSSGGNAFDDNEDGGNEFK